MRTTAWAHLPNAAHIDRVLASVESHPDIWVAAWVAAWDAAWDAARVAARKAAREAAWGAAWDAAKTAAWDAAKTAAWGAARDAARYAARDAARDAALALIAYDDCGDFLNLTPDELKFWHALSDHPAYLLLQPAVIAFSKIAELEMA